MSKSAKIRRPELAVSGIVFSILLNGCASVYSPQPDVAGILRATPERPKIGEAREKLRSLPPPVGRITTAVYGFGDLTGQNKPSPASGLSTAVTQGASSSLVDLMLESGWFRPVERVGLQAVLSERSIWEQRLSAQQRGSLEPLPPASIIFEGGIVAYEFNTRTGGIGAKILGIGGSREYREDVLTVSLRAVNAQTGVVLSSVASTKRIYSQTLNTGLFGFVSTDVIAEVEGGWASNESVQAGLGEAIAFALIDLIAEGLAAGTWQLSDPEDIRSDVFAQFLTDDDVAAYLATKTTEEVPDVPEEVSKAQIPKPSAPGNGSNPNPDIVNTVNAPISSGVEERVDASSSLSAANDGTYLSWTEMPLEERAVVQEVSAQTGSAEPEVQMLPLAQTEPVVSATASEADQVIESSASEPEAQMLPLAQTEPVVSATAPEADQAIESPAPEPEAQMLPLAQTEPVVSATAPEADQAIESPAPAPEAQMLPLVSVVEDEDTSGQIGADAEATSAQASNAGSSDVEAAASQAATAVVKYLVVGYSSDTSAVIDFQRWLDDRYGGVDVVVIRSADKAAYQVAIGPFEDASDVGLVATDLQGQGIVIVEAPDAINEERLLQAGSEE